MITQMKKYTFLVFHREYEAFLEQLREVGVVHITEKAAGMADDAHLQELLAKAENTRKIIAQGAPDQLLTEKANLEQRIATTQKVNLFEKVQIPGFQDAIRKIKRFMEDEENLSKSSQKIVKSKREAEARMAEELAKKEGKGALV